MSLKTNHLDFKPDCTRFRFDWIELSCDVYNKITTV